MLLVPNMCTCGLYLALLGLPAFAHTSPSLKQYRGLRVWLRLRLRLLASSVHVRSVYTHKCIHTTSPPSELKQADTCLEGCLPMICGACASVGLLPVKAVRRR